MKRSKKFSNKRKFKGRQIQKGIRENKNKKGYKWKLIKEKEGYKEWKIIKG